jgi:hypothetical protein
MDSLSETHQQVEVESAQVDVPLMPYEREGTGGTSEEKAAAKFEEMDVFGIDDDDDDDAEEAEVSAEQDDDEDDAEDEDEDEDEDEPAQRAEQKYKIKLGDGEVAEVTLAELQQGYQRQQDYTRKTQAVAEARNYVRAQYQEQMQVREALHNAVTAMSAWAQTNNVPVADIERFLRANAEQGARQREAYEQETLAEEAERLVDAMPEWRDPAKRKAALNDIRDYALSVGYSDEDLAATTDHRALILGYKSMMYDRIMKQHSGLAGKVKVKHVLRPGGKIEGSGSEGSAGRSAAKRDRDRLRRTGRMDDAARVMERVLFGGK